MKHLLILLTVLLAFTFPSKAQYITIPDPSLRSLLLDRYPSCFNALQQMDTTCSPIINETQFAFVNASITDWQGFQYLRSLQYLDFFGSYPNGLPVLPSTLKTLQVTGFGNGSLPALP